MARSRSRSRTLERSRSPPPRRDYRQNDRRRSPTPPRYRDRSYSRTPPRRQDRYSRSRSRGRREDSPPTRRRYSPSPPRRRRSPSPPRRSNDSPPRSRPSKGGFRWKNPSATVARDNDGDRRLERGYRERDRPRQRSPPPSDGARPTDGQSEAPKKEKKKTKAAPIVSQEMIIVTVNDRLGTKTKIPCLASDPIKLFKVQVAAQIGRKPHEIMLKRQGERPFKDVLTLEDYGVSNGVQLDLELDTGD